MPTAHRPALPPTWLAAPGERRCHPPRSCFSPRRLRPGEGREGTLGRRPHLAPAAPRLLLSPVVATKAGAGSPHRQAPNTQRVTASRGWPGQKRGAGLRPPAGGASCGHSPVCFVQETVAFVVVESSLGDLNSKRPFSWALEDWATLGPRGHVWLLAGACGGHVLSASAFEARC